MKQESIKQSALCEQEIKGLSESEFQFYRKDIASNFGLNVTAIDKIRKAVTQEQQKSDNTLDIFVDYEPYDGYVSISETIRDIKACIDECMYIQPEYSLVVALWCVVTWFLSVLDIAPYMATTSCEDYHKRLFREYKDK